jgi:hypothetical protein
MSFIAVSVVALYRLISAYRDAARAQKQNRQSEVPPARLATAPRHLGDMIGSYHRQHMKEPCYAPSAGRILASKNCQSHTVMIRYFPANYLFTILYRFRSRFSPC